MGWTKRDVLECTVPEFWEFFEGWKLAHGIEETEPMTRGTFEQLCAEHGLKRRGDRT